MKVNTFLFYLSFFIFLSCKNEKNHLELNRHKINLKWNKAYADDNIFKSVSGLKWALSYIGATQPSEAGGIIISNNTISINLSKLGFNLNSIEKLAILHEKIIGTEEYKVTHAIDLGRYVSLLLGATEHYYEIAQTPKTLNQLLSNYRLKPEKGYVNNSGVSKEHRIIRFSEQKGFKQVFISIEVDPITGEVYEHETIELLPNGQLRFGIYDSNGNRINNANPSHSNAGKPAKCMWCHESIINPLYTPQEDFAGYLSASELQSALTGYSNSHQKLKATLNKSVDFKQKQQHTLTELLYISFMEPSAERLALEWNLPLHQVQSLLSSLPTHIYYEFPFLGNLYHRDDIEKIAPFNGLPVSSHVREASKLEVNHIKQ